MIVLDTSAVIAYMNRADPHHLRAVDIIDNATGPRIIPTPILSELAYMVETRINSAAFLALMDDILDGAYLRDCCEPDLKRTVELQRRYSDMSLGFADASVIACAERLAIPAFALDMRHFPVVAREGTFRLIGPY